MCEALAALEWIRARFAPMLPPLVAVGVDARLLELRAAVNEGDLDAASAVAARLRTTLRR